MSEFESAVIIVLILLVLFSTWTMYSRKSGSCSQELAGAEWFADNNPRIGVDSELDLLAAAGYQELLNLTSVDKSTKDSHKEYVAQSLGRVSGASKATILDHDIDTNWRGLRRPKNVTPADDALQQYGANDSDFTKGTDLRW